MRALLRARNRMQGFSYESINAWLEAGAGLLLGTDVILEGAGGSLPATNPT